MLKILEMTATAVQAPAHCTKIRALVELDACDLEAFLDLPAVTSNEVPEHTLDHLARCRTTEGAA